MVHTQGPSIPAHPRSLAHEQTNLERSPSACGELPKCPTGIEGLDEITGGGLPRGPADAGLRRRRLRQDAARHGVPGPRRHRVRRAGRVHGLRGDRRRSWPERRARSASTSTSWSPSKKLVVDHVHVERSEIEETGEYDLEGLFIRLGYAIDSIGAKRVVLDTIETLFGGLDQPGDPARRAAPPVPLAQGSRASPRSSPASAATGTLTRHGLEEYVSDCVILLDHRVIEQVSTRRLRVVKYRGSPHGTNEYPFLIDEAWHSRSCRSPRWASTTRRPTERISTGIPGLDAMLGGEGFYRGSSVLVRARPAPARRSIAAHFADAALPARRALPVLRLRGIAEPDRAQHALDRPRPGAVGQEGAAALHRRAADALRAGDAPGDDAQAGAATSSRAWSIVDPISNLIDGRSTRARRRPMLTRLIDFLKAAADHRRCSPA